MAAPEKPRAAEPSAPEVPEPPLHAVRAETPLAPDSELPEEEARRIDLTWSLVMVAALGLVFALLSVFSGVAIPVLLGLAGAYVFNPVVTAIERRGLNRTWGTIIVFAGGTL